MTETTDQTRNVAAYHRLPHHPWHKPEDGPAIELRMPIGNDRDVELANRVVPRACHAANDTAHRHLNGTADHGP